MLKQGWLWKRASGRLTSGHWQRRWFVLQSDGALYHLSSRNADDHKPVVNLHIATVKADAAAAGERASFVLVSPSSAYTLRAEDDADRQEWIDTIQVRPVL